MWREFRCSRNSLLGLNVFYIAVAIYLIALATNAHTSNGLFELPIIAGIIACGVFLLIVSIGGIYSTLKHHQTFLFFYMVILFALFIIQFSISCACLVSETSQRQLAQQSLLFSFTEIFGAMLACHFRNLYRPLRSSPS